MYFSGNIRDYIRICCPCTLMYVWLYSKIMCDQAFKVNHLNTNYTIILCLISLAMKVVSLFCKNSCFGDIQYVSLHQEKHYDRAELKNQCCLCACMVGFCRPVTKGSSCKYHAESKIQIVLEIHLHIK